jgi:hypothetical protein
MLVYIFLMKNSLFLIIFNVIYTYPGMLMIVGFFLYFNIIIYSLKKPKTDLIIIAARGYDRREISEFNFILFFYKKTYTYIGPQRILHADADTPLFI